MGYFTGKNKEQNQRYPLNHIHVQLSIQPQSAALVTAVKCAVQVRTYSVCLNYEIM